VVLVRVRPADDHLFVVRLDASNAVRQTEKKVHLQISEAHAADESKRHEDGTQVC